MAPQLEYTVRRSTRARRVRVSVDPQTGVEVVLPRAPARAAAAAVVELRPWIDRRLAEAEAVRELVEARGDTVPYLGATLALVPEPGRTRVHRRGDALHVPAGRSAPRHWSAGTAARRAPRSPRGSTRARPRWAARRAR